MAKTKESRLGKALYELFCLPVVIDCHCEKCEPRGSPELDILSDSCESEVFVSAQTSLTSLVEDNEQDNEEISPPEKGKWRKRLKVLKDFFCEPVIIDCHCKKCEPKASPSPELKSQSIDGESEVYVTAQTSLTSLVEDNEQDNEEVFFDCLSELSNPEGSPELDSQSIDGESEVYVTAQTSLTSLVEDNEQDNEEIPPRKKGKWRKRLKVLKDFFCEPVIIDCHCKKCEPKASPSPELKSQSIDGESEVYVTAQTSLTSLVEDNEQDNEEVFFDCLSELSYPEGSPELDSQRIDRESEVYVTAQTSLTSLVEDNEQDNEEISPPEKGKWRKRLKVLKDFFCEPVIIDCHCKKCEPKASPSPELKSQSIDGESEVYVTAQTSLTSLVEDNEQDNEEVFFDCLSELSNPEGSPELDSQSIDGESEVYVTAQTSLTSLVEDNEQDNEEIPPRKKGKWRKRLKVLKDFFCEPVIIDCHCKKCEPKASPSPELKSQSIDGESEVYVTAQTSLTSLVDDNEQDNEEVFFDCLSELSNPEGSPELDSQSIDGESEVYVTAQTILTSLVEDNEQDNEEIPPRKKGKWRKRLKVLKDFFCEPVIIDCHCKKCEPKASPSPELKSQSIDGESEVYVTAQTSLTSLVEDNKQDNEEIAPRKMEKVAKAVKNSFCMQVFFDCLSELSYPEGSPELDSQRIDRESEVYVTAQTSLTSLVEDNEQDNEEISPPEKGKWRKRLKVLKDFFCEPVIIDCHCKKCEPKASPSPELKSQSIDGESEVYVTAQTSLTSLVEDNEQDNEEVFFDCLSELSNPEGSPELDSQSIDGESEVYVTAQTSLTSLVEDNEQDNEEVFFDCLSELSNPEGSPELDSQSIDGESEVYVTAQTILTSLVEDNEQDNEEIPPRKKGKWRKRLKVLKDFFCEPVIIDCHCKKCEPKASPSPELKSQSIDGESEVYVTAQTSLTSLVEDNEQDNEEVFFDCLSELSNPEGSPELDSQSIDGESEVYVTAQTSLTSLVDNTQDNEEIAPRKKGKWKRRLKALKDFFCEPVIIDCHCKKCVRQDLAH